MRRAKPARANRGAHQDGRSAPSGFPRIATSDVVRIFAKIMIGRTQKSILASTRRSHPDVVSRQPFLPPLRKPVFTFAFCSLAR